MTNLTNNRQTCATASSMIWATTAVISVFQVATLQAPVPPPITSTLPSSEAAQAWAATLNTTSVAVLEEFVRQFGDTPYAPMARARLEELKKLNPPSPEPPANARPPSTEQRAAREECDRLAAKPMNPKSSDDEGIYYLSAIDGPRAIAACRQAVESSPNDPRLIFQLGRGYHADKNFSEAMRLYRQAAERGNGAATNEIGYMYYRGAGVSKDPSEEVRWWRKAADLGDAWAVHNMGYAYRTGQGVPQDFREAARFYRKAADLGNARSFNALGVMYRNGNGVSQDSAKPRACFAKPPILEMRLR